MGVRSSFKTQEGPILIGDGPSGRESRSCRSKSCSKSRSKSRPKSFENPESFLRTRMSRLGIEMESRVSRGLTLSV